MDRRFKLSLLGATVFAASQFTGAATTGASAADLLPPPPIVHAPEIVQKSNTGWYLRGDISYDFQDIDGANVTNVLSGDVHRPFAHGVSTGDSFNIGGGIGYQINDYLRTDFTADFVFDSDFHGGASVSNTFNCIGGAGTCKSTEDTQFTQVRLLANAYYDIGKFGGFTPYVGAGIGGVRVSYDDFGSVNNCTNDPTPPIGHPVYDPLHPSYNPVNPPCPGPLQTVDKFEGEDSLRFAWALHAGTAYDLTSNLKLDVGYTFTNIEDGIVGKGSVTGLPGKQFIIRDEGFENHTIRAGLRYTFGGGHH